jgi:hypothetical protein
MGFVEIGYRRGFSKSLVRGFTQVVGFDIVVLSGCFLYDFKFL